MLANHIGLPQIRDLANKSQEVSDVLGLEDMPRLAEILHPDVDATTPRLKLQFAFSRGAQGFPEISGTASGSLGLRCQRCLGVVDWPLDVEFSLVAVASDAALDKVADPFDAVLVGEEGISLQEIAEDELLACLPLAPVHEKLADCLLSDLPLNMVLANQPRNEDNIVSVSGGETSRPFAGLAAMLKHGGGSGKTDN